MNVSYSHLAWELWAEFIFANALVALWITKSDFKAEFFENLLFGLFELLGAFPFMTNLLNWNDIIFIITAVNHTYVFLDVRFSRDFRHGLVHCWFHEFLQCALLFLSKLDAGRSVAFFRARNCISTLFLWLLLCWCGWLASTLFRCPLFSWLQLSLWCPWMLLVLHLRLNFELVKLSLVGK